MNTEIEELLRRAEELDGAHDSAGARSALEEALRLVAARDGPVAPTTACVLDRLSHYVSRTGEAAWGDALSFAEQALAIRVRLAPPQGDEWVAESLMQVATIHRWMGREQDAYDELQHADAIYARLGAHHYRSIALLPELWSLASSLGRHREALATARLLFEATAGDELGELSARRALASSLMALDQYRDAIPQLERLLELYVALDAKKGHAKSSYTEEVERLLASARSK